jgi:hypothetical protein
MQGAKIKAFDEKETTPKCKGLRKKTSDEKIDNSKMQRTKKKDLR